MDIYEIALNIGECPNIYTYWINVDLYTFEDIIYDYERILHEPVIDKVMDDETRYFFCNKKAIGRIIYKENEKRKNSNNQDHTRTI